MESRSSKAHNECFNRVNFYSTLCSLIRQDTAQQTLQRYNDGRLSESFHTDSLPLKSWLLQTQPGSSIKLEY